jgi:hypothetical protein
LAVLGEVDDAGSEAVRVEEQSVDVERRAEFAQRNIAEEPLSGAVADDDVATSIECDGRERLVVLEHERGGVVNGAQVGSFEVGLSEGRSESSGQEESVLFAQRESESMGETQDHVAAGLGAAGLDEAQVARGDVGVDGELELAEAERATPDFEFLAEGGPRVGESHETTLGEGEWRSDYLRGNGESAGCGE